MSYFNLFHLHYDEEAILKWCIMFKGLKFNKLNDIQMNSYKCKQHICLSFSILHVLPLPSLKQALLIDNKFNFNAPVLVPKKSVPACQFALEEGTGKLVPPCSVQFWELEVSTNIVPFQLQPRLDIIQPKAKIVNWSHDKKLDSTLL